MIKGYLKGKYTLTEITDSKNSGFECIVHITSPDYTNVYYTKIYNKEEFEEEREYAK